MGKAFFLALFVVASSQAFAQLTKSVELKPIYKQGSKYYYDLKKLKNGYALQVPLLALEDDEINKRFRNFTVVRKIGRYSYLMPLIYLITISSSNGQNQAQVSRGEIDAFNALFWGAVAANITCNIISNYQLGRGVSRYNILIFKNNSLGLQMDHMLGNQQLASIGIAHHF